ncbi:laminin subunit alpha-1 isoform X2 [Pieris brassicae]|uniref:laminin subunit alpha-1 isoform X2 n=1 Tax=Pieris brassicae TaxID=7116 RepID=UPI001E65FE61|nr:laminin subunit alpha-1 isoform X2 [Pieris brassicae]
MPHRSTTSPLSRRKVVLPLGEAWAISDDDLQETMEPSLDEQGKPFLITYEVEGWESFYWLTNTYSGEQLEVYGGEIRASLYWGVARGDTGGSPTVGPDFILISHGGKKLTYINSSHENTGQLELVASLRQGSWYQDSEVATRSQLLDVLSDLRSVMIRAHFHNDQDEVRLEGVEIRSSHSAKEVCLCPNGYEGPHCSKCSWTHVKIKRASGSQPSFECVPCGCNMHAGCNTVDGPCGECQHNTTGPHCERCLPGHYGNPVTGGCKPCACPLYEASNNFSPNCALAGPDGDEFVCTQCPDGYTGDHCEMCDSGYWGSPTEPGGSCIPCSCGGGPCHTSTGACLVCPPHTEGERCDQCQDGYWSGGEDGSCVSCSCGRGALSSACDARTGLCACAPSWAGQTCDSCAKGYGDVDSGCPTCRCGIAAVSPVCETENGTCECTPGALPPHCDTCQLEYWDLTADGCRGCNCSRAGSESNVCDIRTGQCRCKPHVTGRACDTCAEGYWGLERGECRRCECGAGASACDPVSGMCACAAGVGGARCDRCLTGYYGFSATGCLLCPHCSDGKVCSPVTGRCVCPGRSRGPGCSQCAKGYWGRELGCKSCACGPGAVSDTCDMVSGPCECRVGWTGRVCDRCERGFFGPRCRPCRCSTPGTRCSDVCECDENGRCPCKENVVGDKCDRCLEGTFGLSETNPVGCTACFCFGRAAKCTQADVVRAALHAAAPMHLTLLKGDITNMEQESLLAVHTRNLEATISVPQPPVPVYAELGEVFLGDRVMSYGGALRFRVEEEGGEPLAQRTLSKFPLVSIHGGSLVLDHYERLPAINGSYAVYLHESLWEVRGRNAVASRGALMLVLQDLQHVFIRVSTRMPNYQEPLHILLLNVSLETAVAGLSRGAPAPGVEMCECGTGFSSGSCHKPAAGFWLPPTPPRLRQTAGTILIHLENTPKPCDCNRRAKLCHPNTGDCMNCTDNTSGRHCENCADGYFGIPDGPGGCQPCPCPAPNRNRAISCSPGHNRLHCYCRPGYTGIACESCAAGWVRNALGDCEPCTCDTRGALTQTCDAHARCHCRTHVVGDKCDRCDLTRHYLDEGGCRPCNNCTQTLLDTVEAMTTGLHRRADITELTKIPQPFPALREFHQRTSYLHNQLRHLKTDIEKSRIISSTMNDLEETEHRLFTSAHYLKTEAARREKEAQYLSLEGMSGLEEVLKQRRLLGEQVATLDDFARGEKHLSAHRALKEARRLLKAIKEIQLVDYLAGATDVSDSANLQSTSVHEYSYRIDDIYRRVHKMQAALDQWENKMDDVVKLSQVVWNSGDVVTELRRRVAPSLVRLKNMGLQCRIMLEEIAKQPMKNLTQEAKVAISQSKKYINRLPQLIDELQSLKSAAEEKEGILYNLTPVYKKKYLDEVVIHAAMLNQKAEEYKNLFAGTRAAASLGVQAAGAWSAVSSAVKDAGAAADNATAATAEAIHLARGQDPLIMTANVHWTASEELKKRGTAILARADELGHGVESAARSIDSISVGLRALGWRERSLAAGASTASSGLGGTDNGALISLKSAGEQAERVFAVSRALYDEAAELRRRVRYNLRRKLAALQRLGDTALGAAEEHVSQIRGNTLRGAEVSEALAAAAAARAREHSAASASLEPALRSLRERVERARHAAGTITVSVRSPLSGVGCARAYSMWNAPSVTRLSLAVSFDGEVKDGTLIFLKDQEASERYMRLSVVNNRLRLSWNVGGDEGLIVHPEPLLSTLDDADHTAYNIDIERVWSTVRLRVERSGSAAVTSTNSTSSVASSGLLRASVVWLGETVAPLPGCVHALKDDSGAIGLWAFTKQPPNANCIGCTHRRISQSRGSSGWVQFSGSGYAEVRRSGLRPADRRRFTIAFTFRTKDHNALLFLALDTVNNRSVSVWLRSCRVVFAVQYEGSLLEISSSTSHCDGSGAHVQATRVFNGLERGSLRVNGEETLGSPSPPVQSAALLPDLQQAVYWLGGTPPGDHPGERPPPLMGCIGALTVDREGYDLLDTPTRHGVEPGCSAKSHRSAIFEGEGYIEMPSPAVRRKSSLGVSFRSRSPSGLLVYRAPAAGSNEVDDEDDGDDGHYLVMAIVKGELEVIAAAGKGELRLRINETKLDDGRLHSIRLIRAHKQLEVWIDEKPVGSGALAGGGFAPRPRGLFLGGAPPSQRSSVLLPANFFVGTITDFIADSTLLGLEDGVSWGEVRVGRADSDARIDPPTEPQADSATLCTKMGSYTVEAGAVKFGDSVGSYASLKLPRQGAKAEFSITLQIRTFATEGILFLIPGSKQKAKHYTALVMHEGKMRLIVRGRKRKEISLATSLADGTWRAVTVRISRNRLVLSSGGAAATSRAPAHSRANRIYVGGLPAGHSLPNIPNAVLRVGSFRGCIRRVSVCGRAEDLVRDARAHAAVGQCFPSVERGAYFAGDAYAVWSNKWWTEESEVIEVRLQFRSFAANGVIISGSGATLEIKNGLVVLSGGGARAEWHGSGNSGVACDGAWHSVIARISAQALSLSLDGAGEERASTPTLFNVDTPTSSPLFIGGLPEGSVDASENRENFKGCIREVSVGGVKREWPDMQTLHHVLLDSCPTS